MLKSAIMAACACAATFAVAAPVRLSEQQVRDLIAGATVEIDAPFGNKIPVRYGIDGQLTGQAGGLASYLGSATDTGRWWITSDQLCHKWKTWFASEPQCLRLSKEGRTIHWQSQDGNSGTAAIAVPAPPPGPRLVATPQPAKRLVADPAPAVDPPIKEADTSPIRDVRQSEVPRRAETVPVQARNAAPARAAEAPKPARLPAAKKPTVVPDATRVGPPAFVVANVEPGDVLNVRSGPSAEFDVVGALPPGSRGVSIVGSCQSEWCPVQHMSTSGWVNRAYLSGEAGEPVGVLAEQRTRKVSADD